MWWYTDILKYELQVCIFCVASDIGFRALLTWQGESWWNTKELYTFFFLNLSVYMEKSEHWSTEAERLMGLASHVFAEPKSDSALRNKNTHLTFPVEKRNWNWACCRVALRRTEELGCELWQSCSIRSWCSQWPALRSAGLEWVCIRLLFPSCQGLCQYCVAWEHQQQESSRMLMLKTFKFRAERARYLFLRGRNQASCRELSLEEAVL